MLVPVVLLWFIAGGSASVTRAAVMYSVACLGTVFKRRTDALNALGLAGVLQIAVNPFSVFGTGFLLSYASTAAIIIIMPILKKKIHVKSRLLDGVLPGIAVNVGILPLVLYMFNGFSLLGILLNMFAAEIAGILCAGGYAVFLLDRIPFFKAPLKLGSKALVSLSYVLEQTASEVGEGQSWLFRIETPSPSLAFTVIYYSLLVWALLFLSGKRSGIPLTAALVALSVAMVGFCEKRIEFLFFDVGQGNSVLVKTRDGLCGLVDTGTGSTNLAELLKKEGVDKLDFLVISHGHNDHYGGFEDVISAFLPEVVFVPDNELDEVCSGLSLRYRVNVVEINGSARYGLGKYSLMEMYEPEKPTEELNNGSLVIKISGKWGGILLPGDAETEEQSELLEKGIDLSADYLCLGHHGSITSGDAEFLERVAPKAAVVSVGHNNSYGHPSDVVLERLQSMGVGEKRLYRTDRDGAVRIRLGVGLFGKQTELIQSKRLNLY